MQNLLTTLRIATGLFFIVSGVLKLFPVEPFELSFISVGVADWNTAPFWARLVIASEFLIGLLLIINFKLKKITLPVSFFMMALFTLYLIFELINQGNTGSCGCFGIYFQVTPAESLLKNVAIVSILLLLWFAGSELPLFRFQKVLVILSLILSIGMPFLLNPVDLIARKNMQPEVVNFELSKEKILNENTYGQPSVDLFSGKHVVSFMTLSCPHCIQAAAKIRVIQLRHPEISFFIFLNGKEDRMNTFFSATGAENIPHNRMNAAPFASLTGGSWPQIWWVENGVVIKKSNYYTLNEEELVQWYQ